MSKKIAVIVGSLRKESINRKIAHQLVALAPASLSFEFVDIGALPLYNQDLEENGAVAPAAWSEFRTRMKDVDGVLFFTPEYNRSMPAALKNAIDVGSRPYGASVWSGKPAGIVSVSPGALGGFGANHALRQCMVFLDMPMMQQPEAYIGNAANQLDADGKVNNDGLKQMLTKIGAAFAAWVEKHPKA